MALAVGQSRLAVGQTGRCPECGCVGPNPCYEALGAADTAAAAASLAMWTLEPYLPPGPALCLRREVLSASFAARLVLVRRVGELAERSDLAHHPDLRLHAAAPATTLTLHTHSAGGLTQYDVRLGQELDRLLGELATDT